MKYHKIQSLFKRDRESGKFIDEWSREEFGMLQDIQWRFDEKVDGMNIRIFFDIGEESADIYFRGRTDRAQLPTTLVDHLQVKFSTSRDCFNGPSHVVLFGEGYGAKIQDGGGYREDQGFILFDVNVNGVWLKREDVEQIAEKFEVPVTPIIGEGTLAHALSLCKYGFRSKLRESLPEGLILRPKYELRDRRGDRIISKLKLRDFRD
jgi:hypothetical protein